jgi:hypothetical protein
VSTDFDIVCDACKVCHHLGQRSVTFSFGFGRKDGMSDIITEESIGEFIDEHFNHNEAGLRLVLTDALSSKCCSVGFEDVTPRLSDSKIVPIIQEKPS